MTVIKIEPGKSWEDFCRLIHLNVKGATAKMAKTVHDIMLIVERSAKRHLTGGNPLKVDTGRLRASVTSSTALLGDYGIIGTVGTNVFYGKIHEYGGTFNVNVHWSTLDHFWHKKLKTPINVLVRSHKVKFPARPWLAPSLEENADMIFQRLNNAGILLKEM